MPLQFFDEWFNHKVKCSRKGKIGEGGYEAFSLTVLAMHLLLEFIEDGFIHEDEDQHGSAQAPLVRAVVKQDNLE